MLLYDVYYKGSKAFDKAIPLPASSKGVAYAVCVNGERVKLLSNGRGGWKEAPKEATA